MSHDIIRHEEAESDRAQLVEEQAALRRVATLVASGVEPGPLFDAVAGEVAALFRTDISAVVRFEGAGTVTVMGAHGGPHRPGARVDIDPGYVVAAVYRTQQATRFDLEDGQREPPAIARALGVRSALAAPIVVEGQLWGAITVALFNSALVPGADRRLADFSALVATAIANTQAREQLTALAEEQGALRRVATLVAEGVDAHETFEAVCRETCRLLDATSVTLSHHTVDGFEMVAGWSLNDSHLPIGTRLPLEPDTVGDAIARTRAPARVDSWEGKPGELACLLRERGVRSSLGAPVVVEGQLWGALIAGTDREEPLPDGTEFRLARVTELVATAISNAAARSELIASRARIVTAADEARQRIERNLHDGTQQRLIALGLDLQRIRATIPEEQHDAHVGLERVAEDLLSVLEDLRELSRGLHPPLLTRRGLRSALRSLARDSPIPVELEIDLPTRPPAPLETALYYVVSESLTNAIKHSHASVVFITIEADYPGESFERHHGPQRRLLLHATIADDGVGGADPSSGSGLTGLVDRVEALGGRFVLDSPCGGGTRISIEMPLETR